MTSKTVAVWLPQVIIESILIVLSILVALGLDSWRENREDEEFVRTALSNFLTEIRRNQSSVEFVAVINTGLRQVLNQHYVDDDIASVDEFVSMVESYSPAELQSTAWDTALATGSLAKMDYGLVNALSLTYSKQDRYHVLSNSGVKDLTNPQYLSDEKLNLAVRNSIRFLTDATSKEEDLAATYAVAAGIVQTALREMEAPGNRPQATDLEQP